MKHIDLTEFAEHSQTIPEHFLHTSLSGDTPLRKRDLFVTHLIDGVAIMQIYVCFRVMLEVSIGALMVTKSMSSTYGLTGGAFLNVAMISIIAFAYFTGSYFFNQGQTFGMHMMKKRISMGEHSFESAFKWTLFSLSTYLTFGMSLKHMHQQLKEKGHGSFSSYDHSYQELMAYKTWNAPALIEQTEPSESDIGYEEVAA